MRRSSPVRQPSSNRRLHEDFAGDIPYWCKTVLAAVESLTAEPHVPVEVLRTLAGRLSALADGMRFEFLYDRRRRIFSIGYRLADADGPGRLDTSFYDLLASEARLASFVAIVKGDVPQHHWFHLGRLVTNVGGRATLMSWGGTMFEYLMPQLLMRNFPGTLLEQSCRASVRRQIDYGKQRNVPWGISESAYAFTDREGNYQYRAFGVPGLGLKRGLSTDLVIAPYATALASLVTPAAAAENFERLAELGLDGRFGFYEALDYTPRSREVETPSDASAQPTVVRAYFAHHQGMSLVALANVICQDAFVGRFHSDPRVQATELLLQERVPREAILSEPRPAESTSAPPSLPVLASRRFRSPHTTSAHTHILSNGRYRTSITNAGGGFSMWRDVAITRLRDDPTSDAGAHFIYLRDPWSSRVWSATYQPVCQEPDQFDAIFDLDKVTFRRRDTEIETQLEITVSSEDDVEVRRLTITNHSAQTREIEVTSYAEIVLARARGRSRSPGVWQAVHRDRIRCAECGPSLQSPSARIRRITDGGFPCARRRRSAPRRRGRMGDRPGAVHRPRAFGCQSDCAGRPGALGHDRRGPRSHWCTSRADPTCTGRRHPCRVCHGRCAGSCHRVDAGAKVS